MRLYAESDPGQLHPLPPTGGGRGALPRRGAGRKQFARPQKFASFEFIKFFLRCCTAHATQQAGRSGVRRQAERDSALAHCYDIPCAPVLRTTQAKAPSSLRSAGAVHIARAAPHNCTRTQHSRSGAGATAAPGATVGQPGVRDHAAAGMLRGGHPHPQERVQGRSEE